MKRFLKTAAFRIFALVLAALLLGSLLSLALRGGSSPLTSAVGLITSPLQGFSMSLSNRVRDFASYFESSKSLQARLAAKDEEIAALREKIVDYDETRQKLALYEEFLELKRENPEFKFREASIIGVESEGKSITSYTLNRGRASGIKKNDPVLYGQYLVGVVAETELTSCTVRTILNPKVNVAIYETLTGELGVANSPPEQSEQGLTAVSQLERTTPIITGCLICTSGRGGIYPKDLIVGTVTDVVEGEQSFYVTALVQPAVDFSSLRDVLVLIEQ